MTRNKDIYCNYVHLLSFKKFNVHFTLKKKVARVTCTPLDQQYPGYPMKQNTRKISLRKKTMRLVNSLWGRVTIHYMQYSKYNNIHEHVPQQKIPWIYDYVIKPTYTVSPISIILSHYFQQKLVSLAPCCTTNRIGYMYL